jgi:hypothetical protein
MCVDTVAVHVLTYNSHFCRELDCERDLDICMNWNTFLHQLIEDIRS